MKRLLIAAVFGCLATVPRAEPIKLSAEDATATRTLLGDIYAGGRAFDYLAVLADELGPQPSAPSARTARSP